METAVHTSESPAQSKALAQRLAQLPPGRNREEALNALANQWVHKLPFNDAANLADAIEIDRESDASLTELRYVIAADSTGASFAKRFEWFVEGEENPDLIRVGQLVSNWTRKDYNATAAWLRHLEPSPVRDRAISRFATMIAGKEPPSAVDWALQIADQPQRDHVLRSIYSDWFSKDQEGARAYFLEKKIAPANGVPDPEGSH